MHFELDSQWIEHETQAPQNKDSFMENQGFLILNDLNDVKE